MIKDENSTQLESAKIWDNVINDLNGEVIKAQTIQTADFGPVSQKQIIQILRDVFKAKPPKRHGNARSWVFDPKILDKLSRVYDLDVNVKVQRKLLTNNENGAHRTDGTLAGDGTGLDKHILDIGVEEIEDKFNENIGIDEETEVGSTKLVSENDNNDTNNSNSIENTTVNNTSYSDKASQVSHVSQINDVVESSSSIYSCHYCDYISNKESELIRHSINAHPNKIAQPDESIRKLEEEREV